MTLTILILTGLLLISPVMPTAAADGPVVLVDGGQARVVLVLPEKPHRDEILAAQELSSHVERMTGVSLPRAKAGVVPEDMTPIRIGDAADPAMDDLTRQKGSDPASFTLAVRDGGIDIRGLSPDGTLIGVYELLEQFGVRWYMPGEIGTVIPTRELVVAKAQMTTQTPSFAGRNVSGMDRVWTRRNRLGGTGAPSSLSMPAPGDFQTEPELFALVDGKRHPGQLCVSNPRVVEGLVAQVRAHFAQRPTVQWIAMGNHGGRHCECADCRALDPIPLGTPESPTGPYTGGINVTDRYIRMLNQVLEAVAADLPDKRIALTVASGHMLPPVNQVGHERLDIVAWAVGYCRFHGVNNPVCPERTMVYKRIQRWVERLGGHYYERGSWGNVAGPGFLFPGIHRFRRDMPDYHAAGVAGFRTAAYNHWISENPSAYVGARLLWDHTADADALLIDFCERYYGPAWEPMLAYHQLLEATVRDTDHHTGTAFDMPHIYTPAVRQQARAHLVRAAALAMDPMHRQRIEAVGLAVDYLEAFIDMLAQSARHEHAAAAAALNRARDIIDQLLTRFDTPLLNRNYARPYLDRFFGGIVDQAHERTTGDHELAAGLDDVWQFQIDPQNLGEDLGWHEAQVTSGNWQPLRTATSSWSNQGLRYYQGHAWYRQAVVIPQRFEGRRIMLWFGAADEQATVWVNGHPVGVSHTNVMIPFEFDVTHAVRFGEPNMVSVRVRNAQVDEVGTGGLLAPVMFYASPKVAAEATGAAVEQ